MATDLTVILENRPGTLAEAAEALGGAGINIDGSCGFPCGGEGIFHILVEDAAGARSALEKAGFEVRDERDVLVLDVEDRRGSLGAVCRRIADVGVNVDLQYIAAAGTQIVLGADNIDKARSAV